MVDLHRTAMKFAQQGFLAKENGLDGEAVDFFTKAFDLEYKVAHSFFESKNEPTRSVIIRSAASLAMLSQKYEEMRNLVKEGLSGNPPVQIFHELLNLIMNDEQQKFCYSENKFTRLLAPAGSGKTIAILWKCLNLLTVDPKAKFLIFTFTRVARDELKSRIDSNSELYRLKDRVRVETLNQWGFSYIKNVKSGIDLKISNTDFHFTVRNNLRPQWENKKILNNLANANQLGGIISIFSELKTLGFNHSVDTRDFIDEFVKQLSWLENNGLGLYFHEKVFEKVASFELLDQSKKELIGQLKPFLLFWQKCTDELWNQAILTLEDQKYWALRTLENTYANGQHFPASSRYHHIFVDEFQDINPLDLALIRKLCEVNNSSLSIVGDDDQAIYEWRGSSPKFIVHPDQFIPVKFETIILRTNYRSPKNIVEISQTLIKKNNNREKKDIVPFRTNNAEIDILHFNSHLDCLPYLTDLARQFSPISTGTLAIISRKKGQLVPLQISLTSNNISYFAKEDLNILFSKAFNELKEILILSINQTHRKGTDEVVEDVCKLCGLVKRFPLNKADLSSLKGHLQKFKPKSLNEGIDALKAFPGKLKSNNSDIFFNAIMAVMSKENVSATIEAIEENFEGLQKHYAKGDDDIFYKEPPFLYLSEYAKDYADNYWKFIDHVESAIVKMTETYNEGENVDPELQVPVHLMTALRAKGKEFDTVVVLDVNDGLWPIKYALSTEQLEQERRLFYVAITRTKKRLILITVDNVNDKPLYTSPYISEMGL